jgi:plasmid stabilization system protein ParE
MNLIRFLRPAELELLDAAHFYELQAAGLGGQFLDKIDEALEGIRTSPQRYPVISADIRRCLVQQFPYALIYRIDVDAIIILATMHLHRRPDYWVGR